MTACKVSVWLFTVLLQLFQVFRFSSPLELCSVAKKWELDNHNLVLDYRGRILLVSFIDLQACGNTCNNCLARFEKIVETLSDVHILVVAGKNENAHHVRSMAIRFPRIRFEHESRKSPIWSWLGAAKNDHLIFDRCSRLSARIKNSLDHHTVFHELKLVTTSKPCGVCPEFDRRTGSRPSHFSAENLNREIPELYVHPKKITFDLPRHSLASSEPHMKEEYKSMVFFAENSLNTRDKYGVELGQSTDDIENSQTLLNQSSSRMTKPLPFDQQTNDRQLQHRYFEKYQQLKEQRQRERGRGREQSSQNQIAQNQKEALYQTQSIARPNTTLAPVKYIKERQPLSRYNYALTHTDPNRRREEEINLYNERQKQIRHMMDQRRQREEAERQKQLEFEIAQRRQHYEQSIAAVSASTSAVPTVSNAERSNKNDDMELEISPLYPEDRETDDYYYFDKDLTASITTETPLRQIQPPTTPLPPTQPIILQPRTFGLELPCTGYNDQICYQQQTQLATNEVHHCCRQRVLLTDQCIEGKCSNFTQPLCCIQRFLQAKLTCCNDRKQGEITHATDQFSRCCFENFVDEDDVCCPRNFAHEYWRSTHELCLPSVQFDLRKVKVRTPILGTQLMTEFDFSKTDKWKFECPYGDQVQQFSYFEEST